VSHWWLGNTSKKFKARPRSLPDRKMARQIRTTKETSRNLGRPSTLCTHNCQKARKARERTLLIHQVQKCAKHADLTTVHVRSQRTVECSLTIKHTEHGVQYADTGMSDHPAKAMAKLLEPHQSHGLDYVGLTWTAMAREPHCM
jgi:hypothetical protein